MKRFIYLLLLILVFACKKDNNPPLENPPPSTPGETSGYYFPATNNDNWSSVDLESIGWNTADTSELFNFMEQHGTRAFIILYKGKIAIEKYWGNNILNTAPFTQDSKWYWASAGKTITAFLVGLAQEEGFLNINDKTSNYLGSQWTSMSIDKENLITIKHQLTMTTGLDYNVPNQGCTTPNCLQYKTDAGNQWFYHNAPYTLLESVMNNATGISYNDFTDQYLESKIGMQGNWQQLGDNNVYLSTARDAARFGLLLLNKGKWADKQIMNDMNYFNAMINSSQALNPSYGYLFWLNGKTSIILPSLPTSFNQQLSDHAPTDLFAGIGKNGQYVNIVPSKDLVIIRMGESPDTSPVPTVFHDQMWEKINQVLN